MSYANKLLVSIVLSILWLLFLSFLRGRLYLGCLFREVALPKKSVYVLRFFNLLKFRHNLLSKFLNILFKKTQYQTAVLLALIYQITSVAV